MRRKFIPVEEVAKEWFKDPEFVAEYDALEEEFVLAAAQTKARDPAETSHRPVADATSKTAK